MVAAIMKKGSSLEESRQRQVLFKLRQYIEIILNLIFPCLKFCFSITAKNLSLSFTQAGTLHVFYKAVEIVLQNRDFAKISKNVTFTLILQTNK